MGISIHVANIGTHNANGLSQVRKNRLEKQTIPYNYINYIGFPTLMRFYVRPWSYQRNRPQVEEHKVLTVSKKAR